MRILLVLPLALALGLGTAAAGDDHAQRLTVAQAAEAATFAHVAGDAAALQALARRKDPAPWMVADALRARGQHHAAEAFAKAALQALRAALAVAEERGDKRGVAGALIGVGLVRLGLGEVEEARRTLEQGVRLARREREQALMARGLEALARLDLVGGNPGRALARAHEALAAAERLLGGTGVPDGSVARPAFAKLRAVGALAAARTGDAAEVLTFLESGRASALLSLLSRRALLAVQVLPAELKDEELGARAALVKARDALGAAVREGSHRKIRAASEALDQATTRVQEIALRTQQQLLRQTGAFNPRPATLEQIASSLEPDEALVIYGLCLDHALALVLRRRGTRIVRLGPVKDVIPACGRLNCTSPEVDSAGAVSDMRSLVVEPLHLGRDIRRVVISPQGPLWYVPFGVLFEQATVLTPSGTIHALLRNEQHKQGRGVLALGDPDYAGSSRGTHLLYLRGRRLVSLPATRAEAQAVGTQVLVGGQASEAGLRQALAGQPRWKAVHFACHGLTDAERPLLSSLALTRTDDDDGLLTVLEVLRMQIPTDLAVLAASETAKACLVPGEGVVGLSSAFLFAGASRVLGALWKVDDEATRALMVRFYELWHPRAAATRTTPSGRDGSKGTADDSKAPVTSAAEALHKAQAYVRLQPKWKHPYYWAAWVLWGSP